MVEEIETPNNVDPKDPPSKVLFNILKAKGFPGTYDNFVTDVQDPNNRKLLYQKAVSNGRAGPCNSHRGCG